MSTIDQRIDALYELPLAEFTAARNTLAKSLTGPERDRVKALQKPTTVAWSVNLLYWRERKTFDRLLRAGQALRAAQVAALKGKQADIREATSNHREALGDAVSTARQLAATVGTAPDPDALARMLEALSVSPAPAEHPGRWVETVQPAGFEALAGITPVFQPRPAREQPSAVPRKSKDEGSTEAQPQPGGAHVRHHPSATRPPTKDERAAEKRRLEAEAAKRKEAEAALRSAKQEADRAIAAEARAGALVEQARQQLAHAEAARQAAAQRTEQARKIVTEAEARLAKL